MVRRILHDVKTLEDLFLLGGVDSDPRVFDHDNYIALGVFGGRRGKLTFARRNIRRVGHPALNQN